MISWDLALALRDAGLRWRPVSGDRFRLVATGAGGEVFTVSDMTIEPHEFDTGVVLGFNGTTEWALDSVALEDALWHPHEAQLRDLLGTTFRSLERAPAGAAVDAPAVGAPARWTVRTVVLGTPATVDADDPADAYALALLRLVAASASPV